MDVKNLTSDSPDQMAITKRCFWKGQEMDCPSIFQPFPTDRGMCCVFNMEKADQIFRKSKHLENLLNFQSIDVETRICITSRSRNIHCHIC